VSKISINEILKVAPQIKLATEEDNFRIIQFLKTVTMKTDGMELYYDRSPDFFSFLKEQGEKFFVFLFENKDSSLHGMAIITLRKAYVNNSIVSVGYLSDLRIDSKLDKRVRVIWRKIYANILKNCENIVELNGCKYFYSAILGGNETAINSLTKNKGEIIYHQVAQYKAVTILGRLFKIFLDRKYVLKQGNEIDHDNLISFLDLQETKKMFGYVFNKEKNYEINRRLKYWKNYSLNNFLVVCKRDGTIVSATLPWCDEESRKLVVKKASLINKVLGLSKYLLNTKPLFEGEPLKFLYLTHLVFDSSISIKDQHQIIKFYLQFLFRKGILKKYHGISFLDFSGFSNRLSGKKYVKQVTDGLFFQVAHSEKELLSTDEKISFEIAIS